MKSWGRRVLFLGLLALLAACRAAPGQAVTFVVDLPAGAFSRSGELEAHIWTSPQLATAKAQENCTVSENAAGAQQVNCPPGVVYQPLTPEKFSFPLADLPQSVRLPSRSIHTGERYLIVVFGKSADDCNTTSASFDDTAENTQVRLSTTLWATTEMACSTLPPP